MTFIARAWAFLIFFGLGLWVMSTYNQPLCTNGPETASLGTVLVIIMWIGILILTGFNAGYESRRTHNG